MSRPPTDLLALVGVASLAVAATVFFPDWEGMRVLAASLLVLGLPGYALTAALFPPPNRLRPAEEALLSVGLSVFVPIIGGVVLSFTAWGLDANTWAAWLWTVTVLAGGVAEWRRPPAAVNLTPSPARRVGIWTWLGLTSALVLAGGAVWLGSQPASSQSVEGYTLFWLLPDEADAGALRVGIESQEFTRTHYRLALLIDGQLWQRWPALELATGEKWETDLSLLSPAGQVEARLYRADQPEVLYRHVTLKLDP